MPTANGAVMDTLNGGGQLNLLGERTTELRYQLHEQPGVNVNGVGRLLADLTAHLGRHTMLQYVLTDAYHGWRAHYTTDDAPDERYLLLRHGDPTFGVATLSRLGESTWLVSPDAEAAAAFDIPYTATIVGQVAEHDDVGWQPTAYRNPQHRHLGCGLSDTLPPQDDLATACRTLLRWWRLRHSAAWHSRRPEQLTEAERANLAE